MVVLFTDLTESDNTLKEISEKLRIKFPVWKYKRTNSFCLRGSTELTLGMWAKNGQFNMHIISSADLDWQTLPLNVASLAQNPTWL